MIMKELGVQKSDPMGMDNHLYQQIIAKIADELLPFLNE
jgi:hypothetical protein